MCAVPQQTNNIYKTASKYQYKYIDRKSPIQYRSDWEKGTTPFIPTKIHLIAITAECTDQMNIETTKYTYITIQPWLLTLSGDIAATTIHLSFTHSVKQHYRDRVLTSDKYDRESKCMFSCSLTISAAAKYFICGVIFGFILCFLEHTRGFVTETDWQYTAYITYTNLFNCDTLLTL